MSALLVLPVLLVLSTAATPLPAAFADEIFEALDGVRDVEVVTVSDRTYALMSSLANNAVQIVDVTDPSNPLSVAALFDGRGGFVLTDVADIATVVAGDKTYALVASFGAGIVQVVDLTDPANPFPVTDILNGQDGFVLDGPSGIAVLDIQDKTYALVTNMLGNSIQIIDVTDPPNPLPVASIVDDQDGFDALDGVRSVAVVEISGAVYALGAAWNDDAVQVLDVTDPANPLPVASVFDERNGFDALASADRIIVTAISENIYAMTTSNTDDAVQVIDITDPANPLPTVSIFNGDSWPAGIDSSEDNVAMDGPGSVVTFEDAGSTYALVAVSNDDAVHILDVTDPANPSPVAMLLDGKDGFEALNGAYGIALVAMDGRTYALVAASDDNAVQILDVTDPADPSPVSGIFDDSDPIVVQETAEVDVTVMAQIRFDTASLADRAHALVTEMALTYQSGGATVFAEIAQIPAHGLYAFVLDAETFEVEADGTNSDSVGTIPDAFANADWIREDLQQNQAMWLNHMQRNSDTGTEQLMRSWLYLHDGHVFGAGYFVHDSEVQSVVDDAILKYKAGGAGVFDEIASATDGPDPFVLDAATAMPVAYGGPHSADLIYNAFMFGTEPYSNVVATLNRDGYAWVSYVFPNTDAHIMQLQRTWLVLHDGYIFASGYHLSDSRIQSLVEGAILLYQSEGEDAFDAITPRQPAYTDALYPFVLNSTTSETVAHGAFPDRLGAVPTTSLHQGDRPWPQIQEELRQDGSAWVSYVFTNPDTRTDQLKRTHLQLYDGYIFASGYYLPDARVQSVVDESISAYRSIGTDSFDILNSGAESTDPTGDSFFATVVGGDGTILASGAPTDSALSRTHGLVVERDRAPLQVYVDLVNDGHAWVEDIQLHPATGTEQVRRTWLTMYDNYVFTSGYYLADSEVQSVVDKAVFLYVTHGQAAFDMITPEVSADTDALYPFVLDFDTSETIAHGAYPHLVGDVPFALVHGHVGQTGHEHHVDDPAASLHEGVKPWSQIQEELLADGSTWSSYIFTNPDTDTAHDKRTWLYLHDGYVFVSGYYVEEARVQALVRNAMHAYNVYSANVFGMIDAIADEEETVQLYPFVIDPETMEILAQGIGTEGTGTDLAALTDADRTTDEILAALDGTSGTWSVYEAVNPLTGETEHKRSWLSTHGDYIFGVGYYDPCLDLDAPGCEAASQRMEATPTADVAITEGSAYPACSETDSCFDPHTITVEPGTAVTWTNQDNVLHTVTESAPDPEFDEWVNIGEEFTYTFDEPGTYAYGCTIHPTASGVVIVGSVESQAAAPETDEPATPAESGDNPQLAYDLADEFIALYVAEGVDAFESITAMSSNPDQPVAGFVVDTDSFTLVAHSSNPLYVGLPVTPVLAQAFIPIDVMLDILAEEDEGVWLSYPSADTRGNLVGYDRGWMKLHDGYVFVARFAVDSAERVQGVVEEMIRLYDRDPETAFDTINSFMSPDANYPFVMDPDTTMTVADGSNLGLVGVVSILLTDSSVPLEDLRALNDGEGVWTEYAFTNPQTGMEQAKRSWVVAHDGYLFASGYYP